MRGVKSLQSIVDQFAAEVDEIEAIYHQCKSHPLVAAKMPYLPSEEGCLFAIWDAWSRFLRQIVVATSAGPVQGLNGNIYSASHARSEAEVLTLLRRKQRGQNYKIVNQEPNWHDERALADIVSVLQLPNAQAVISAVTATSVGLGPVQVPSPLTEIRKARNFSAHKNWKTLADISAFDPAFSTLSVHLRKKRRGVETFLEWSEALVALGAAVAR